MKYSFCGSGYLLPAITKSLFTEHKSSVMTISNMVLLLTTICTSLMAGLFYSYSCSVVPGLKLLTDPQYLAAMQSINKAIQNPVFFICFFGTLLLLPLSTYLKHSHYPSLTFRLLLTATILYYVGVFGVTALGNIPLNNGLEKFELVKASAESISLQRSILKGDGIISI